MPQSPKQNLLDRLIAYIDPARGARRMQARTFMATTDALGSGVVNNVRRLSGSREGTLQNWTPRREERWAESLTYDTTMQRAESLAANDGHAHAAINALALNTVGTGLRPQSYPDTDALGISEEEGETFATSAEAAWALWCEKANADGVQHFDDLQYTAAYSLFTTGEILQLAVWREQTDSPFGLALRPLHPARLRTPSDMMHNATVRCGVHIGKHGEPLGYMIANPADGYSLTGLDAAHFSYVPRMVGHRQACFHLFHASMPEQVRGVSILSPAMKQFRDLADYVDYQLVGALIAASFTVFIETSQDIMGAGGFGEATKQRAQYSPQVQPGTLTTGNPGDKPHLISTDRPGPNFDAFYERVLRAAAASTGQPYEMVSKDFSKTTYSSARAALLEVWKLYSIYQEWLVRSYLTPLWRMVIEEAWLRGLLAVPARAPSLYDGASLSRAWLSAVWTRPPRGQIDQTKEREAEQMGLDAITDTRTAICHSRGLDFETLARTRQREENLLKKLGLTPSPTAPAPVTEKAKETTDA